MTSLDGDCKNIEDLQEGDLVVSYNIESGKKELKAVTLCASHIVEAVYHIKFDDGTKIDVSGGHPLYSKRGWVINDFNDTDGDYLAMGLTKMEIGDEFETFEGRTVKVESIECEADLTIPLYDIAVEGLHNYFANSIIAHNAS